MHTTILQKVASLPVIREVLGASVGGGVALTLYVVFEFGRGIFFGNALIDALAPLHASATAVMANGVVSVGLTLPLALAGACALLHKRMMSDCSTSLL